MELLLGFVLLTERYLGVLFSFRMLRGVIGAPVLATFAISLSLLSVDWSSVTETGAVDLDTAQLLVASIRELLTGVAWGLPFALIVEAIPTAGRIADVSRGAQFAEQVSPGFGSADSVLESLGVYLALLVIFPLGGYHLLLHPILTSAPELAGLLVESDSVLSGKQALTFIAVSSKAITLGFALAAPVVVFSLLLDIAGALLSRSLSRVNVLFELMPMKMLLGAALFLSALFLRCFGFSLYG